MPDQTVNLPSAKAKSLFCDALQSYATASFSQHSLLATINVVRAIVAAAVQPAYAKLSDVFGRVSILVFSVTVYVVGQ